MSTHTAPDQFLERDDARLRWRLEGSGPPIALLHGWALDLEYWDPLAVLLTPRFTVLRFDRCGFGLSVGLPNIHRNVDDLRALLAAAAIVRPALLGMSQGARLAIHFALRHPTQVRALLLDGPPALEADSELPMAQYRQQLAAHGCAALQAEILQHPLMQLQTNDPAAHRLLANSITHYSGLDLLQHTASTSAPDLGSIAVPTLVINGSRDSASRQAAGRMLQAAIPGAQRLELPGAGHLAQLDDPAAYAAAVTTFCNRQH